MAPRWHDRSTQGGPPMSVRLDTSVAVVSTQSLRLLDATMREYPSRRRKTVTAAHRSAGMRLGVAFATRQFTRSN